MLDYGAARTQIIVDTRRSALATLNHDNDQLAARSALVARFLSSDGIRRSIAGRLHVAPDTIALTAKPATPDQAASLVSREPLGEERANDLLAAKGHLKLTFQNQLRLPVVDMYAQAPTSAQAAALANAAVDSVRQVVTGLSGEGRNRDSDIVIRQGGLAIGGSVASGTNIVVSLLVAAVALTFWLVALSMIRSRQIRLAEPVTQPAENCS